jgi:sigma-B regulation protein RsbU (phosphoserine phosphatase)
MPKDASDNAADRFALLYRLSQAFNSSLDLDEVLNRVMDEVILATNAERGYVTLREPDGELVFRIARGMDHTTIKDPQFQISHSVVEEVAQNGKPVLTSNAQEDERFSSRQSVMFLGLRSIICAPLKIKDFVTGVIYVENRIQAGIFTQADLELLGAIAGSAAIAIENARLYQVAVEKGRMERELQMAYRVQSSLIPEATPDIAGWKFATHWQPAREVAGDYYDFIPSQNDRMGLVIADVTDKGMPAALFMALTRSIVRACLDQASVPAEGLTKANRFICADSTSDMPVTLFYGLLDPIQGELTYVNAGHNPPIHFRAAQDEFIKLTPTGMFLGFDDEATYEQRLQVIKPGDFVVFYTDGVTDAINAEEQLFGQERFESLLADHRTASAAAILGTIKDAIKDFTGGTAPYDDITLLVAKRL